MNNDENIIDVTYSVALDINNNQDIDTIKALKSLNSNDYVVLASVRYPEKGLGECEAKGITKDDLVLRSKLSLSTVNRALPKLLKAGLIKEAIKQVNKKAYYLSAKGTNRLKEVFKKEW